jgi:hypothetical protein
MFTPFGYLTVSISRQPKANDSSVSSRTRSLCNDVVDASRVVGDTSAHRFVDSVGCLSLCRLPGLRPPWDLYGFLATTGYGTNVIH